MGKPSASPSTPTATSKGVETTPAPSPAVAEVTSADPASVEAQIPKTEETKLESVHPDTGVDTSKYKTQSEAAGNEAPTVATSASVAGASASPEGALVPSSTTEEATEMAVGKTLPAGDQVQAGSLDAPPTDDPASAPSLAPTDDPLAVGKEIPTTAVAPAVATSAAAPPPATEDAAAAAATEIPASEGALAMPLDAAAPAAAPAAAVTTGTVTAAASPPPPPPPPPTVAVPAAAAPAAAATIPADSAAAESDSAIVADEQETASPAERSPFSRKKPIAELSRSPSPSRKPRPVLRIPQPQYIKPFHTGWGDSRPLPAKWNSINSDRKGGESHRARAATDRTERSEFVTRSDMMRHYEATTGFVGLRFHAAKADTNALKAGRSSDRGHAGTPAAANTWMTTSRATGTLGWLLGGNNSASVDAYEPLESGAPAGPTMTPERQRALDQSFRSSRSSASDNNIGSKREGVHSLLGKDTPSTVPAERHQPKDDGAKCCDCKCVVS